MSRALAGGCYRYPLAAIVRQLSSWPKQINLSAAEPRPRDEGIAFSPLSKIFKVYPRAMHHSHNHEQNVSCSQYRSHEMTPGSSKEVEAGLSTLGTGHGHSYLKALLAAQYCCAPQFRVDGTKSTAYAQADFTEARCDALYPLAGGLGELHVEVGQPTIWGLPARQILVAGFVRNIGRSSIFSRGGPAYPGVSSLLRAQTRSYKTRMANRSIRDQKKRLLVQKYEMKRAHYKAICHDRSLSSQVRYDFALKLSKLPRNSSKTRLKNRCVFTGRSHSVYRKFGISRLVFRELASRGALTGVNKASW